ncbi:hypothetical protein UT300006_40330 [Clostridium sp. CTA-6]
MKIFLLILFMLTVLSWSFSFFKWITYSRKKNINKAHFWVYSLLINSLILNILNLGMKCIK